MPLLCLSAPFPSTGCRFRLHHTYTLTDTSTHTHLDTRFTSMQNGGGLCSWRLTRRRERWQAEGGRGGGGKGTGETHGAEEKWGSEWHHMCKWVRAHTQLFSSASSNVASCWVWCNWPKVGAEETDRTRERGGSQQAWITQRCCKWWRYQGFGGLWVEAITTQ